MCRLSPPDLATLLDAGFRIPGPLLFARRNHFADVVGVVLSDTGHRGSDLCKRRVVCGLHELLQFCHYPIEFLQSPVPLRGVESESRIIIATLGVA